MTKQRRSNVVSIDMQAVAKRHHAASHAFLDMDPEVHDLVRMIDLAISVYHAEFGADDPVEISNRPSKITDDGHVLPVLLEHIRERAKELRVSYREHDQIV
jgi:hypothetical protein